MYNKYYKKLQTLVVIVSEHHSDVQLHLLPGHKMPSMSLLDQKEDVLGSHTSYSL